MAISLHHGRSRLFASMFQIAIVTCCLQTEVDCRTKQRQNCAGDLIELKCPKNSVISITSATLRYISPSCCKCPLNDQGCRKAPSEDHQISMHRNCNGLQRCKVTAEARRIFCNWWWRLTTSEHISFKCKSKQEPFVSNSSAQNDTSTEDSNVECSELDHGSVHGSNSTCDKDEDEVNQSEENDEIKLIVIIVFICLGTIVAIIGLIVVISCRKKKQQAKSSLTIETSQYNAEYEEIGIDCNIDARVYHHIEAANPTQNKPMNICAMVNHPKGSIAESIEDRIYYDLEATETHAEPYNTSIYEEACEVNGNLDGAVQQKKSETTSEGHSANPGINKSKCDKNVPKFKQEVIASDGILPTTRNEDSGLEIMKQDFTNGNELVDRLQVHAALDGDFIELTVVENDLYSM